MYTIEALIVVSALLIQVVAQNVDYCSLSCDKKVNTICRRQDCGPVPGCREKSMDEAARQFAVDMHNSYRNKIATGQEKRFNGTVSNMLKISYDMELERMAQCHANECIFGGPNVHDDCRKTSTFTTVGQNIQSVSGTKFNKVWLQSNYSQPFFKWYNEIAYIDSSSYANYTINRTPGVGKNKVVDHFSQLVWASTNKIGCARAMKENPQGKYKYNVLYICNYGPTGNVVGSSIFQQGEPASKCPQNYTKDEKYPGLCAEKSLVVETRIMSLDEQTRGQSCSFVQHNYNWFLNIIVVSILYMYFTM